MTFSRHQHLANLAFIEDRHLADWLSGRIHRAGGVLIDRSNFHGLRSERVLIMTLAEMYVQRVSTSKVTAILEHLCGTPVSVTQVS